MPGLESQQHEDRARQCDGCSAANGLEGHSVGGPERVGGFYQTSASGHSLSVTWFTETQFQAYSSAYRGRILAICENGHSQFSCAGVGCLSH